jgi:NADPH:quinone reductase-like Zn-dependent oxidoreductase
MKDISPTSKLNSLVPCFDMSGTVITAPPDSPFQPRTEVYACTNFYRPGAGREYTICETSELACKPETLSFVEASTVPMSAETAWQALFVHAALLPVKGTGARGKRVFVTGASGAAGMVRKIALSAEVPLLSFSPHLATFTELHNERLAN